MCSIATALRSYNRLSVLKLYYPSITVVATICSKEVRDPNYKKAKPFDYINKRYTYFHWHVDSTLKRFDENSKIIVVDGNIGAGKTAFAKSLAEQFDMKFIPEPTVDPYYTTPYGTDLRALDPIMPPSFKSCDIKTFYQNPRYRNVGSFQMKMFMLRYVDYIMALCHLFNTGEGIVLDRSVYADFIFMETMCKMGYVRKEVRDFYNKVNDNCVEELRRPHLIVYLDVSPEVALQRIKQRNDPIEVNSEVFQNTDYLQSIDELYKQVYLPRMAEHTEVLVYDWNDYGEVEVVIEDIEKLDLDTLDAYSLRLRDWLHESDWSWGISRWKYTNQVYKLLNYTHLIPYEAPELIHPGEEVIEYQKIMDQLPDMKYRKGYNTFMNEHALFKGNIKSHYHKFDFFPNMYRSFGLSLYK